MRRLLSVPAVVVLVCATLSGCGAAGSNELSVQQPWVRVTGANAAAYMDIDNDTKSADALLAVTVDPSVSENVQLHQSMSHGGDHGSAYPNAAMMTMQPVQRLDIPAGGQLSLSPGGYHIMLSNVQGTREPGATIALNLQFEKAGIKTVEAEVRP